ncbi:F-box/LRR-repeat protein 2-like [Mya arenaria]|uniref:F-box/LRR-repeat protein 2-like n=1 Tax=Mya arenaria TaxID=6604 RepID=UPI0022E6C6F6|nr:F-box/LRR-repeat protein 2-like [Mya arenaria]
MVKTLSDISLNFIQNNLHKLDDVCKLPTVYKELLLEQIAWHDLLTESYVPHMTKLFSKSLTKINFYKCEQISDNLLKSIAASECKLESLSIIKCFGITDDGVQAITRNQTELKLLRLRGMKQLTDNALKLVWSENLIVVDLKQSSGISFKGVDTLAGRNRQIKELYLWGVAEHTHRSRSHEERMHAYVISLAYHLGPSLEVLDTKLNQMCDECLVAVASYCPNMRILNLHGSSKISGQALTKFSIGCPGLKVLDLSFCTHLCSPPDVEALWTLPTSLTDLSLIGILLTDTQILVECLQRLRRLKCVKLCGVPALNDETLAQILEHIGAGLTLFDISGSVSASLTDKALEAVTQHCSSLEALHLSLIPNMTGTGLLPLLRDPVRATRLKGLAIGMKKLSYEVLSEVVAQCSNLERLHLSGVTCVDDEILTTLAQNCPGLSRLCIKGCRLVTDVGVCELARHCSLVSLVVSGVGSLTDASIFCLANCCPQLEEIYMNGCANISPVAVRYLKDCTIPRLFVGHATPNAAPDQLMARNLDTGQFCRVDKLV